jgi:hypothetical protein
MTANKMSAGIRNNDIGLYPARSRVAYTGVISADVTIGEIATWVRAVTGGWIVYRNPMSNEDGVEYVNDGEKAPICFDKIYSTKSVDGKTTTAQTVLWYSTPQSFSQESN